MPEDLDDTTPEAVLAPYGPLPRNGRVRPMTRWGTPVMHRPQAKVEVYDEALTALAADMVASMYAADGVGLAACQGQRVVGVVCNPVLVEPEGVSRRLDDSPEGCLSFPGAFVDCARPDYAAVEGTGLDGAPVRFEGDGLLAKCLQHETDHTLGTVFGDRISAKAMKKLRKQHDAAAEDYPPEWPT